MVTAFVAAGLVAALLIPAFEAFPPAGVAAPWLLLAALLPPAAVIGVMVRRLRAVRVQRDPSWAPDIHPAAPPGENIAELLDSLANLAAADLPPRRRLAALMGFEKPIRDVLDQLHEWTASGQQSRGADRALRDGRALCRKIATSYIAVVAAAPETVPPAMADRALAKALDHLREELLLTQTSHLPAPRLFWRLAGRCYRAGKRFSRGKGLFSRGAHHETGAAYRRLLLQGLLPPIALTPSHRRHSLRLVVHHGHRLALYDHDPQTRTGRCWVDPREDRGPQVVWGQPPTQDGGLWIDAGPLLQTAQQQFKGPDRDGVESETLELLARRFSGGIRRGERVPVEEQATVNTGFCNAVRAMRAEGNPEPRSEGRARQEAADEAVHEVVCDAGGFQEWDSNSAELPAKAAEQCLDCFGVTARVLDLGAGGCRIQLPPGAANTLQADQPLSIHMPDRPVEFGWVRWLNPQEDGVQVGIELLAERPSAGRLRLVNEEEDEVPIDCFVDDYQGERVLFLPEVPRISERHPVLEVDDSPFPVRLEAPLFHDGGFEIRRFSPVETRSPEGDSG